MSTQITTAAPQELDEILHFLDSAYGYEAGSFAGDMPWQWRPECVEWHNTFVIRDAQNRLASLVRIWELPLVQGGRKLTVGGVGSVATAAHARGQGGMSALMEHANREMRQRNYPLAILCGDRFRYEPFGYHFAGRTLNLNVTARGLKYRGIEPLTPASPDAEARARMEAVRTRSQYHLQRRECENTHAYGATRHRLLVSGPEEFAYLVLNGRDLCDWGGHAATALRLAAYAAAEKLADNFDFAWPQDVPAPPQLLHAMSDWGMAYMCSAAIFDLKETLRLMEAPELYAGLATLSPQEQAWQLFGRPDAPRNLWLPAPDMV